MSSGRWKLFGDRSRRALLVLPFLLGALALRFAIAPFGDVVVAVGGIARATASRVPFPGSFCP